MTSRDQFAVLVLGCLSASPALADDGKRPMQLEVGINTRHWQPPSDNSRVAFRSTTGPAVVADEPDSTAVSTSIRFTGKTRYNTFLGAEGEVGSLVGRDGSNLAGFYGVAGAHGDLGSFRVGAEMVAGRRWVRYALDGSTDAAATIAEPRVRGELWVSPRWTLGGAVGATLGDRPVWMAGIYLGVHSSDYAKW